MSLAGPAEVHLVVFSCFYDDAFLELGSHYANRTSFVSFLLYVNWSIFFMSYLVLCCKLFMYKL